MTIRLKDDKTRVSQRDGALVGEVTETEGANVRCRRLYAAKGTTR